MKLYIKQYACRKHTTTLAEINLFLDNRTSYCKKKKKKTHIVNSFLAKPQYFRGESQYLLQEYISTDMKREKKHCDSTLKFSFIIQNECGENCYIWFNKIDKFLPTSVLG
jgi:hypothetical protein